MSELVRILNLDADNEIQVTLGGRPFTLRQQRRAIIEQVLLIAGTLERDIWARRREEARKAEELAKQQEEGVEVKEQEEPFEESLARYMENWERTLPAYALMLGFEPRDSGYEETIAFLKDHLSYGHAERLFGAWWELNEVRRFFDTDGTPMIPRADYEASLAARRAALDVAVEAAVSRPE